MILDTAALGELQRRVTMVDGGFDPLHPGHVAYFRDAAALGLPVFCNVSGDAWIARKHAPLLTGEERALLIDAFRDIAYVHASSTTTAEVLRLAQPRVYAKGRDWEGRLPQEEIDVCASYGINIVYLDTVLASSTEIVKRWQSTL